MVRLVTLVCLLVLAFVPARADDPVDLMERFAGEWTSGRDALGGPAHSIMRWSPALNGRFMRLDYSVESAADANRKFLFQGAAYYRLAPGETLQAFWADNAGDLHPIRAERDGDALIAHWGVEGLKQGRTRYELLEGGDMQVTDWIRTGEGWRQFNENRFARTASN